MFTDRPGAVGGGAFKRGALDSGQKDDSKPLSPTGDKNGGT